MLDYGLLFQFPSFNLIFSRPWESRKQTQKLHISMNENFNVKTITFAGLREGGAGAAPCLFMKVHAEQNLFSPSIFSGITVMRYKSDPTVDKNCFLSLFGPFSP